MVSSVRRGRVVEEREVVDKVMRFNYLICFFEVLGYVRFYVVYLDFSKF